MHGNQKVCLHNQVMQRYCLRCGIYYQKNMRILGIKNQSLAREIINSHQIITILRTNEFDLSRNKDYSSLNPDFLLIFTKINQLCQQLKASFNTKILSQFIFWHSFSHNKQITKDINISIFIAMKYRQTSLMRQTYPQIRKTLINPLIDSGLMNEKDLMCEQIQKLEKINFRLNLVTFIDFLQFYVLSGVMFSNQGKRSSDYDRIISYIDNEIEKYTDKGLFFTQPNQQYLALKILYNARKKCGGIDEIWNWHIQYITQTKKDMIQKIINQRKALTSLKQLDLHLNLIQNCEKQTKKPYRPKFSSRSTQRSSTGRKMVIY